MTLETIAHAIGLGEVLAAADHIIYIHVFHSSCDYVFHLILQCHRFVGLYIPIYIYIYIYICSVACWGHARTGACSEEISTPNHAPLFVLIA